MSYDFVVFSHEVEMRTDEKGMAAIEGEWEPIDMGAYAEVQREISRAFPTTNWSDRTWGILNGDNFSLSISVSVGCDEIQDEDRVDCFGIHARGAATDAIMHLIAVTGWIVLDVQTMEWLNTSTDPDKGRRGFQNFLDKVMGRTGRP